MNKILVIILVLACIYNCSSQSIKKHYYTPRDKNFIDTNYVTKYDKKYSFISERTTLTDGTFADSKLFCIKDTSYCSFQFRIDSLNNWFLKTTDCWVKLFDYKTKKLLVIRDKAKDFKLIYKTKQSIKNEVIYNFIITSLSITTACGQGDYWFSPNFGIIAIRGEHNLLVRKDFIDKIK